MSSEKLKIIIPHQFSDKNVEKVEIEAIFEIPDKKPSLLCDLLNFYYFLAINPATFFSTSLLLKLRKSTKIGVAKPTKTSTGCPNANRTTTPTKEIADKIATTFLNKVIFFIYYIN